MKREALRHPKMLDLASRLGITRVHAIGIVTTLLDWTANAAPQGNIGKWPDGAIAVACEWPGDPVEFVAALADAGWLDRCSRWRYVIHDLDEHSEQWWKNKMAKVGLPFLRAVSSPGCHTGSLLDAVQEPIQEGSIEGDASRDQTYNQTKPITKPKTQCGAKQDTVAPLPVVLQTVEFESAWTEWQQYRTGIRKKLTAPTIAKQLKMLEGLGPDKAVEAIGRSIEAGWSGLFDPGGTGHRGGVKGGISQAVWDHFEDDTDEQK